MGIEPTTTRLKVLRSTTELGGTFGEYTAQPELWPSGAIAGPRQKVAPTRDRTEDLAVNSRSLYQRSSGGNHPARFKPFYHNATSRNGAPGKMCMTRVRWAKLRGGRFELPTKGFQCDHFTVLCSTAELPPANLARAAWLSPLQRRAKLLVECGPHGGPFAERAHCLYSSVGRASD